MIFAIRNCKFRFKCQKLWDDLELTDNSSIRFCRECQRDVVFCGTDSDLMRAITNDECVAVNIPNSGRSEPLLGMVGTT
jgi:hypothetical protein